MASLVDFFRALGGKEGANAYVQNNWPNETGVSALGMSAKRPDTFYTPLGMVPPPSGREPTFGEEYEGAPTARQLVPFLSLLLNQHRRGER